MSCLCFSVLEGQARVTFLLTVHSALQNTKFESKKGRAQNPTRNSPKENSGANGKFLPKPLLFHLRHPNSKKNQPKFWQILNFVRIVPPPARILGGQNPERKTPFPFSKEISPPPNQESKECYFFRGYWRTRQCVGLSWSVRGSFKPPRTRSVRSHYLTLFWK